MKINRVEGAILTVTIVLLATLVGYYIGAGSVSGAGYFVLPEKEAGHELMLSGGDAGRISVSGENNPAETDYSPSPSAMPVAEPEVNESTAININTASTDELRLLPGIGEVLAGRIIEYRDLYGSFKTTDEIMNVRGIGEKIYGSLKDLIIV